MKKKLLFFAGFFCIIIFCGFPFFYAITSSLKPNELLFWPSFFPSKISFVHYKTLFGDRLFLKSLVNSFLISLSVTGTALFLALTGGYSLGRFSIIGKKFILMSILSLSMFPQVSVLSGMFYMILQLGLYDTLIGLGLSYFILVLPFSLWVLKNFIESIPKEIEEAACLDGASPLRTLFKIFFPMLLPSIVTTGLLSFIAAWNEFLFALTFTVSSNHRTVPVAISMLSGSSQYELPWGTIMAASVVVTVPLIILVLLFQKNIVSGLTQGAVKG